MKFFIAVLFLFALAYAKPFEAFYNAELAYPFRDFYAYMQCVPSQIDTFAMEYDCETEWNEYREHYLETIKEFADCAKIEDDNKADECKYKMFAHSENTLKTFYLKLQNASKTQCFTIIPEHIVDQCEPDDMRYSPDF